MSKKKKNKKQQGGQKKTFRGIVEITRSGMAFVIVEGLTRDILVKQKNLNSALDKDEVLVDVIKQARNMGRMEGVITDILKRNKTEFTGTLQVSKNFGFLIPEKGMFMPDIYIPANSLGEAKTGDKAVVKIVAWGEKSRKPVGEIIEILDATNTNDLAMKEILIESGFPLNFPAEVMAELGSIEEAITDTEVRKRKDCRKILTFTIDPVDAKDFDDAISLRKLKNGLWEVGVHIADVSHYVQPGTELDKEAEKRATSVYLPDRVLPMLPEKISNELCSLRPHEDKYTFSAIFQMTEEGEVKQHWIGRTVIHSKHRFTYEEVQDIIEQEEGPYDTEILLLNRMARRLRKERFTKGAINFSSQEVRFKLDEYGKPIGIVIKESKEAHQLIEEFMLLANRTIAAYVSKLRVNKLPVPFPYRVHDTPDEEKLKVFSGFASKFGYKFDLHSPETIATSFNRMLELVKGKPEQHVLETLGIRTMAKAIYTVDNVGHYGLGFEDYCHFTSPIRRYPDVLVHRVLAESLANDIKPDKQMEKRCRHCSEMERKAMDAERAANKYKQVEYMMEYIGHTFEGVVSGVAHFGFWVETVDTKCEGLVSIHNLNTRDEFIFNEGEYALVGLNTGRKFRIGDKVNIRVVAANLAKRQLDYELEEELGTGAMPARGEGFRRKEDFRKKRGGRHEKPYKPRHEERKPVVAEIAPESFPPEETVITATPLAVPPAAKEGADKRKQSGKPKTTPSPEAVKATIRAEVKEEVREVPAEQKAKPSAKPATGKKATPKKAVAEKPAAPKAAAGKAPAKPAKKATTKKAITDKTTDKTITKKATPKKAAAAEKPAKKAAAKKATRPATPKTAAGKTATPKKAAAKKAAAPKAKTKAPSKAAAKKATPKKAATTKRTGKKKK